jgi:RNA polymerase-binding transcription factor DksA
LQSKRSQLVKHSMQSSVEEGVAGLNGKSERHGSEKSITDRLNKQRTRLLRMREMLLKEIHQLTAEACEETPNYSMHPADAGTDSFDRDLVLGLASFEQEGLYEIDAALRRIDDGTYGRCELTGRPIPWKRLEAIPWTRFSVEGERRLEGNNHPHIGALGTVQPLEKEPIEKTSEEAES